MPESTWSQEDDLTLEDALESLDQSLREAAWAVGVVRRKLAGRREPVPLPKPMSIPSLREPVEEALDEPMEAPPPVDEESRTASAFERLWSRIEDERAQKQEEAAQSDARRGLELLPQQYLMTVEDREGRVDLVALHRALLHVGNVDEFSLVSFANGVPVISLRVQGELEPDRISSAVSVAMQRPCELIPQDNARLFLRLKSSNGGGE